MSRVLGSSFWEDVRVATADRSVALLFVRHTTRVS